MKVKKIYKTVIDICYTNGLEYVPKGDRVSIPEGFYGYTWLGGKGSLNACTVALCKKFKLNSISYYIIWDILNGGSKMKNTGINQLDLLVGYIATHENEKGDTLI